MDERTDDMNDMDDMDFAKLFSSLDSVKASDDLKTATLDAIFAGAGSDPTTDDNSDDGDHEPKVVKFPHKNSRNRSNSRRLRIAGIAACFALIGTIGTAANMPRSYASIDYDGTNLTLGINSLGVTVSADADSEKGKKLIEDNDLTNMDYRDSVGTVATTIATHSDEPVSTIELTVSSDNESQRASVKKGSSEALEISGYKKKSSTGKAVDTDVKSSTDASAKKSTSDDAKVDDTEDEDDESSSFVINTADAQEEQKNSEASDSAEQTSKYHPLSDDKQGSDGQAEQAGTESEAETEAEEATAGDSAANSTVGVTETGSIEDELSE